MVLTSEPASTNGRNAALEHEILRLCRDALARHKVPAALHFVPVLAVAATGKLARPHA